MLRQWSGIIQPTGGPVHVAKGYPNSHLVICNTFGTVKDHEASVTPPPHSIEGHRDQHRMAGDDPDAPGDAIGSHANAQFHDSRNMSVRLREPWRGTILDPIRAKVLDPDTRYPALLHQGAQ